MHQITLRGTPAEMGQQHGAMFARAGLYLPPSQPDMVNLAEACEAVAQQYTPELVVEMRAFAEAAYVSYAAFSTLILTVTLQQSLPSCSVVAVLPERSANGKLLIGRNYDFSFPISWDAATTYLTYPAQGHAHIGACDIWIGREDGMNAAGLFVAMSATFLPGVQAGLPFWFIVRHLLETCTTVDEAINWIQSIPHAQSRNYLMADSQRAVVAEASINGVCIREPEDGILAMTNHPVDPELNAKMSFDPGDSQMRYDRLRALPAGAVSLDHVKDALNDRANRVCAYDTMNGELFGTIWSVVGCPEEHHLAIAEGTVKNEGTMNYRSYSL